MKPLASERTDMSRDNRRLVLYFGGLVVTYITAVAVFWNAPSKDGMFIAVMFAPTVGALLARFFGPGVIRWGRPSWWILAALAPVGAVLVTYYVGAAVGLDTLNAPVLVKALIASPIAILSACISAVGEEIGWRGFLWPLLRARRSFLRTAFIVGAVWWLYHVPLILVGWYGTPAGIPAFTVGIVGFTLFVGVLTDRSRSMWPSLVAHAAWNALVATGFEVTTSGGESLAAFTGSTTWVGEFGWLAAIGSLVLGVVVTWWHMREPNELPQT